MQFRVTVPDTVTQAEQTIRIRCPDGTETSAKVPKGLGPGDTFIFEVPQDKLRNPQALLETLAKKKKNNNTVKTTTTDTTPSSTPSSSSSSTMSAKTFLEREMANFKDFFLALTVGLIIGVSILLGFVAGILYVTQDYQYLNIMELDEINGLFAGDDDALQYRMPTKTLGLVEDRQ